MDDLISDKMRCNKRPRPSHTPTLPLAAQTAIPVDAANQSCSGKESLAPNQDLRSSDHSLPADCDHEEHQAHLDQSSSPQSSVTESLGSSANPQRASPPVANLFPLHVPKPRKPLQEIPHNTTLLTRKASRGGHREVVQDQGPAPLKSRLKRPFDSIGGNEQGQSMREPDVPVPKLQVSNAMEFRTAALRLSPQLLLPPTIQPPFIGCPTALKPFFSQSLRFHQFQDYAPEFPQPYVLHREVGNLPPETGPWKGHCPIPKIAVQLWNIVEGLIDDARGELGVDLQLHLIKAPIPNSVFRFEVTLSSKVAKKDFKTELFDYLVNRVYCHHPQTTSAYVDKDELRILCAPGGLQSSRIDGSKNSPLYDIRNQDVLSSHKRAQIVAISFKQRLPATSAPTLLKGMIDSLALMAIFLKTSLRLNAEDISSMIELLQDKPEWRKWPLALEWDPSDASDLSKSLRNGDFSEFQHRALMAAIRLARSKFGQLFLLACDNFDKLDEFASKYQHASEVDQKARRKWLVYVAMRHGDSTRMVRKARPSFYHDFGENSAFDCHVHMVEFEVLGWKDCMIMISRSSEKPALEQINTAARSLSNTYSAAKGRFIATDPIFYDGEQQYGSVFRIDGMHSILFAQKVVAPIMRKAIGMKSVAITEDASPAIPADNAVLGSRDPSDDRPQMIIFWLRKSSWDDHTNIAHQMWAILGDMPSDILPLKQHDRVLVALENCSSTKHMWHERHMVMNISKQMRFDLDTRKTILTAFADRLTRQAGDLPRVAHALTELGARWLFRRMSQDDVDDDKPVTRWADSVTAYQDLEKVLLKNTQLGKQLSFYNKNNEMQLRILGAGENHPTLVLLRSLLDSTFDALGIDHLIIYVRCSPKRGSNTSASKEEWSWSIERQIETLRRFVPERYSVTNGNLDFVREVRESAYTSDERRFLQVVSSCNKTACVLSISLDRVSRKGEYLSTLRQKLSETTRKHYAMCFLWDYLTDVNCQEGLCLPYTNPCKPEVAQWQSVMSNMRDFRPNVQHYTLLQPIFWCSPDTDGSTDAVFPYEEHLKRHVKNAEEFVEQSKGGMETGGCTVQDRKLKIPLQLAEAEVLPMGQYFSQKRQERWSAFISQELKIDEKQISFHLNLSKSSFTCYCSQTGSCNDGSCFCGCAFCRAQLSCSCKPDQACECSEICSCACFNCHNKTNTGAQKREHRKLCQSAVVASNASMATALDAPDTSPTLLATELPPAIPSATGLQNPSAGDVTEDNVPEESDPLPQRRKSGVVTTKCDACIEKNAKCSHDDPCERCTKKNIPCTYSARDETLTERASIIRRTCMIDGCNVPASGKRLRCYRHETERQINQAENTPCQNLTCPNHRTKDMLWCSLRCYIESTPSPSRCQEPTGCLEVVPPGFGTRCEKHPASENAKHGIRRWALMHLRRSYNTEMEEPQ